MVLIVAEVMMVTAIALFFSTFSSPLLAALLTFGLWVAGHFNSDLRNFERGRRCRRSWPGWRAALYYVLPNLAPFDVKAEVVHGMPVPMRDVWFTLVYAAAVHLACCWRRRSRCSGGGTSSDAIELSAADQRPSNRWLLAARRGPAGALSVAMQVSRDRGWAPYRAAPGAVAPIGAAA